MQKNNLRHNSLTAPSFLFHRATQTKLPHSPDLTAKPNPLLNEHQSVLWKLSSVRKVTGAGESMEEKEQAVHAPG